MKLLGYGALGAAAIALIAFLIGGRGLAFKADLIVGGIGLLYVMIASGVFASGDQVRANHYMSSPEDRKAESKGKDRILLLSMPFLLVGLLIFYLQR